MDGYYGLRIGCYGRYQLLGSYLKMLMSLSVVAMGIGEIAMVKWLVAKDLGLVAKVICW